MVCVAMNNFVLMAEESPVSICRQLWVRCKKMVVVLGWSPLEQGQGLLGETWSVTMRASERKAHAGLHETQPSGQLFHKAGPA